MISIRVASRPTISFAGLMMLATLGNTQNLFRNPGFEDIPGPAVGQGLLPSEWFQVSLSADTYSNDGSYGLFPWEFGNFTGVTAHGGIRFVAGANIDQLAGGELFGQTLSASLSPGGLYKVDAWLHQALRFDLNGPGGYDLWLDKGDFFADRLLVGRIGETAAFEDGWRPFSAEFTAPANASEYTRFVFGPRAIGSGGAYPGIDDISLVAVPEPATLAAFVIAGVALSARRRRK